MILSEKWKLLEAELKSEIHEVNKLMTICTNFRIDFENKPKTNDSNNILMRDYVDPKDAKQKQENKRFERFDYKQPFSHHNQDPFENNNNINNNIDNYHYKKKNNNDGLGFNKNNMLDNFVANKKKNLSEDKPPKDPMVWDPPEEKKISNNRVQKSRQSNPVVPKVNQRNAPVKSSVPSYKDAKKKVDDKKGKKVEETNKSPFLLHCYPENNGNGPDSELIEMLEREVVDTNPNIKFEDIAELSEAKNLLKEAVLLPLLIPDYFTVKN